MEVIMKKIIAVGMVAVLLAGCESMGPNQTGGTLLGTAAGAGIGAAVAGSSSRLGGALIGGVGGAVIGTLIGKSMDDSNKK
jgi:hypothetical protein